MTEEQAYETVKRVVGMKCGEITDAIDESLTTSDSPLVIAADDLAMGLVGARHSKRDLVDLVRWLLLGAPTKPSPKSPTGPLNE